MVRIRQVSVASWAMVGIAMSTAFYSDTAHAEKDGQQVPKTQSESKPAPNKDAPHEPIIKTFMRAKLDASKNVLDGVVTENFQKIKAGAEQMLTMSQAAQWNVYQDPVYAQYSSDFRRSVERLIKEADDKDIDGTGLAYMQLTMNCVNCHKYVRGNKIAKGEASGNSLRLSSLTATKPN